MWFIESKFVSAVPATHGEFYAKTAYPVEFRRGVPSDKGYIVTYPDMHLDWVPKEAFESAHLPIERNGDTPFVTDTMVDNFIKSYEVHKVSGKTIVVAAVLVNGFEVVESCSCVSSLSNYNDSKGTNICKDKIRDKVKFLLDFLLQSSLSGFNGSVYNDRDRCN